MKNFSFYFLFFSISCFSQITFNLDKDGLYKIPCRVNSVPMEFIFDTGATTVTISITEAQFLVKQGLLQKEDIIKKVNFQTANGEINEGTEIILRKIEIKGLILRNVTATVVHEQNAPLLLGMSALSKLGKISIENNILTINDFQQFKTVNEFDKEKETLETLDWINNILVQHQFSTDDTKQIQNFDRVTEISGLHFLMGIQEQKTNKPWGFSRAFLIPIEKVNHVDLVEKQSNYWLEFHIKDNEELILIKKGEDWSSVSTIAFMVSKTIDDQNMKPRLKKAFEYLMQMHGFTSSKKF